MRTGSNIGDRNENDEEGGGEVGLRKELSETKETLRTKAEELDRLKKGNCLMNGMGVLQIVYKRREQQLRQQIGKSTRCDREVFTPMLETEE